MTKASRLEPLAELADVREADAARRLAAMQRTLHAKQAELQRLQDYLAEYRRHADESRQAVDSARLQNVRAFLERLSEAIALQEAEVAKVAADYRAASARWELSRKQARTLETLVDRYYEREAKARERLEQTELDERAARPRK